MQNYCILRCSYFYIIECICEHDTNPKALTERTNLTTLIIQLTSIQWFQLGSIRGHVMINMCDHYQKWFWVSCYLVRSMLTDDGWLSFSLFLIRNAKKIFSNINILWFSYSSMIVNSIPLGFELLVGHNKLFEYIRKMWWDIFHYFLIILKAKWLID